MTSLQRVGRIVGLLLLSMLPTGLIVPYVVLMPITTPPAGFLETAAAMDAVVRFNVFLLFLGGALSVGISAVVWPVVRERGYRLGLWMMALAVANFTLQLIENANWLTMLSVSHAYADAGAAGAESYRPIGIAVRSAWRWAHYSHILVVVGWFFTLYAALFHSRVMPRALSAAGMATCVLHVVGITLPIFAGYRMPLPMLFGMPLGVATLAAAAWLMAKGFKASPPASALAFELEKSQLERQALDARLHLLQAQVAPHFLFNTLANVQALVDTGSPRAADVLRSLIAYLRAAVPRLNESASTIRQELELVQAYLDLMHMRMPDRLQFALHVDESALDVCCPPMTLLTLVENAVRHGIDPGEEGGRIDIQVHRRGNRCEIRVSDTGVGLELNTGGLGTGLSTLRERLNLVFGGDAVIRVAAQRPRGVSAELDIPVREAAS